MIRVEIFRFPFLLTRCVPSPSLSFLFHKVRKLTPRKLLQRHKEPNILSCLSDYIRPSKLCLWLSLTPRIFFVALTSYNCYGPQVCRGILLFHFGFPEMRHWSTEMCLNQSLFRCRGKPALYPLSKFLSPRTFPSFQSPHWSLSFPGVEWAHGLKQTFCSLLGHLTFPTRKVLKIFFFPFYIGKDT